MFRCYLLIKTNNSGASQYALLAREVVYSLWRTFSCRGKLAVREEERGAEDVGDGRRQSG